MPYSASTSPPNCVLLRARWALNGQNMKHRKPDYLEEMDSFYDEQRKQTLAARQRAAYLNKRLDRHLAELAAKRLEDTYRLTETRTSPLLKKKDRT